MLCTVWLQFSFQAVVRCVCVSDLLADIKGILMSSVYRSIDSPLLSQPYPNAVQPTDHIVTYSWQTPTGLSSTICTANGVWFGGSRGERRIS